MKVWQIAAGEPGRDYRRLFFDYDVMLLGPSHTGKVTGDATKNKYADGKPSSSGSQIHSFAYNPRPGDRVVMRFGKTIIGVGKIPQEGGYSFEEAFKRVYGWDLGHCRRVIWAHEQYELGYLKGAFENVIKMPSFTQVLRQNIVDLVCAMDNSVFDRPLRGMPTIDTSLYTTEELGIELFEAGISNKNIDDILKALQQAGRLCNWYWSEYGRRPSESEVISHIILPLFLGLGWSHQQIAVEWNKIDMAFFKGTPTIGDSCVMIVEVKGLGQALGNVLEQPINYIKTSGLKNVRYILTTDGESLFVYEKKDGNWDRTLNPIGYISISSPQKEYIVPRDTNLVDTLVMLQPSSM